MANGSNTEALNVLSEVEAQERAGRVSDVGYVLSLSLTKGSPTYDGVDQRSVQAGGAGGGDVP